MGVRFPIIPILGMLALAAVLVARDVSRMARKIKLKSINTGEKPWKKQLHLRLVY